MTDKVKMKLHNALLCLVNNNKINEITVDMICKEAKVSRSTFYRHFMDKYDLLLWYFDNFLKLIFYSTSDFKLIKNYYSLVFSFINNNQDYFAVLIAYKGQNSFEEIMEVQIKEYLKSNILQASRSKNLDSLTKYSIEMFVQGLIKANILWISNGFKETPMEMTEIVMTNIPSNLRHHFID